MMKKLLIEVAILTIILSVLIKVRAMVMPGDTQFRVLSPLLWLIVIATNRELRLFQKMKFHLIWAGGLAFLVFISTAIKGPSPVYLDFISAVTLIGIFAPGFYVITTLMKKFENKENLHDKNK